jgi:hypothetical protein
MLRFIGLSIACFALLFQSSPGMALQQDPRSSQVQSYGEESCKVLQADGPQEKTPR